MAKKNSNNAIEENEVNETSVSEEVVETKKNQKEQKPEKVKASKKKKAGKESAPKKSRLKETFGELKKVTWPSFGKAMKQTGMVLAIVLIFGVVVLGLDLLISFIINLLSSF